MSKISYINDSSILNDYISVYRDKNNKYSYVIQTSPDFDTVKIISYKSNYKNIVNDDIKWKQVSSDFELDNNSKCKLYNHECITLEFQDEETAFYFKMKYNL